MAQTERSEIERMLAEHFPSESSRFTSTAEEPQSSEYVKELARPVELRGRVPLTLESFVISENPARVEWERQVRIFLGQLSQEKAHRVTAPMIYEWTTGISIRELAARERAEEIARRRALAIERGDDPDSIVLPETWRGGAASGSANMHLRHINWVLKEYFGTPHKTTIAGRPVGRAYAVRKYFKIKLKKPANLTLIPDWEANTLEY